MGVGEGEQLSQLVWKGLLLDSVEQQLSSLQSELSTSVTLPPGPKSFAWLHHCLSDFPSYHYQLLEGQWLGVVLVHFPGSSLLGTLCHQG